MEHKSFALRELKAIDDADQPGTFEAIVAVFGNEDMGGDIIEPGAFKNSLESRGLPPIVWSHEWHTPPIGVTLKAEETDEGLYIKGRLFVGEGEDSPVARAVYTAMRSQDGNGKAALREFSFGYQTVDYDIDKKDDGSQVRRLKEVDIFEAGPTLLGMNPETRLVGVKSLESVVAAEIEHVAESDDPPSAADAAQDAPLADKPEPKDEESEEALVRIGRVLHAVPVNDSHKEPTA